MDHRYNQLVAWLETIFKRNDIEVKPASADASFRRYFRAQFAGQRYIVMDAPPEKENTQPYIDIAAMLRRMGLNVPAVIAQNLEQGYFILTDLGPTPYLEVLNQHSVEALYTDAIAALVRMQAAGRDYQQRLPPYDRALLWKEMQLFRDWYLGQHRRLPLSASQHTLLDNSWNYLCDQALAQPRVFVHRDYHSRNLMYSQGDYGRNPGILDFQDAVEGPLGYDLVSLLRDCYIAWPRARVETWLQQYHAQASAAGVVAGISLDQLRHWFDLIGIQRHLKASGIFARLHYRDGKPGYLKDIPRTLGYIMTVAPDYPPLRPLVELLNTLQVMEQSV